MHCVIKKTAEFVFGKNDPLARYLGIEIIGFTARSRAVSINYLYDVYQ